jgi:DNA uptake protein ComE-like DNA-binding protein
VAPSAKKSGRSAEEWLLEPADRQSGDSGRETDPEEFVLDEVEPQTQDEPVTGEAAQWLVEPPAGRNGVATKPEQAEERPAKTIAAPEGRGDPKELDEARRALAEERESNADLLRRISDLQGELRAQAENAEQTLARTVAEQEAEFAAALRERDEALKEREAELSEQLSEGYEKREADLNRQFDRRQLELEKQLAVLEDRIDAREAELRDRASQREAKLTSRIEELQSQLADAKLGMSETPAPKRSKRGGASKNGQLELNNASFEQLRELGLSVTQSARVIAYRDTRGGFESVEELDEIPGLPKETRVAIMSRLRL